MSNASLRERWSSRVIAARAAMGGLVVAVVALALGGGSPSFDDQVAAAQSLGTPSGQTGVANRSTSAGASVAVAPSGRSGTAAPAAGSIDPSVPGIPTAPATPTVPTPPGGLIDQINQILDPFGVQLPDPGLTLPELPAPPSLPAVELPQLLVPPVEVPSVPVVPALPGGLLG